MLLADSQQKQGFRALDLLAGPYCWNAPIVNGSRLACAKASTELPTSNI